MGFAAYMADCRSIVPRGLTALLIAVASIALGRPADATQTAVLVCEEQHAREQTIGTWTVHMPPRSCLDSDNAIWMSSWISRIIADKAQSDQKVGFLYVSCGLESKAEVKLWLEAPLPLGRVTLRSSARELEFEGTARTGFFNPQAEDFMSAVWRSSGELTAEVHNGTDSLRGVVSLDGWMQALNVFNSECVQLPPSEETPSKHRYGPQLPHHG
jgi:hypothetical protein